MSRLLSTVPADSPRTPVGSAQWKIDGSVYDNTAVKFWSGLLDEVCEDFTAADGLNIDCFCDDFLVPDMLDPTGLFTAELESLEDDEEMDETIRELAQELELIGPTPPIHVEVLSGGAVVCRRDLPEDIIDADVLPVFLVWPLEWAGLSEFGWNRHQVNGSFTALDPERKWQYDVTFTLDNNHVREGLFHRKMTLGVKRTAVETG
jgi:hypothetical protein